MGIKTFWLEPTNERMVGMRTYTWQDHEGWTCQAGWHESEVVYVERRPVQLDPDGREKPYADDPDWTWPTDCKRCGIEIPSPHRQVWSQRIWRRTDTGEERFNHSNPDVAAPGIPIAEPGASWDASWLKAMYPDTEDGIVLIVRCPDGHDWTVDSRARNCTMPDDDVHHCWVRHGDPRECRVTVDKDGVTCAAGAGSIQTPNWHGFLRGGLLVE